MTGRGWLPYPRYIGGQIAIVVGASIAVALALLVVGFFLMRPEAQLKKPNFTELEAFLAIVRVIDAAPDQQAKSALLQAAAAGFPDLRIARISALQGSSDGGAEDRYLLFLRQTLGPGFRVARIQANAPDSEIDANRVVAAITTPGGIALRASLPVLVPPTPPLTPIVTATIAFIAASVSLLLLWATKALTAPLSQFADAAEQFGLDFDHRTLPEQGPEEIRKASRAFNQMGSRIKRLVQDRTNMLAAISHDLRTPITRLRLRAEFVEDETLRLAMLKDLEQLNDMVRSALAFLRDSRVDETPTSFDVAELLRTICAQFAEIGQEVNYGGVDRKLIVARPDAIGRAVTNLVENAVKFGSNVQVELQTLADGCTAIDVLDDGPGIEGVDPESLLRPFVRGDNARTLNPQSGFGLGLTIASSIIEAHGGELTLSNRTPHGLRARLKLGSNCQPEALAVSGPSSAGRRPGLASRQGNFRESPGEIAKV